MIFFIFFKNKQTSNQKTKKGQNQVKEKNQKAKQYKKNPKQTGPTFFNDGMVHDNKHLARDACLKDGFLCEEGVYRLTVCPRLRT